MSICYHSSQLVVLLWSSIFWRPEEVNVYSVENSENNIHDFVGSHSPRPSAHQPLAGAAEPHESCAVCTSQQEPRVAFSSD